MFTRRHLIKAAGAGLAFTGSGFSLGSPEAAAASIDLPAALPEGVRSNAMLDALPGKKPLIKLSYRPPNYETPIEYFRTAITPNDAFFVRYHLSNIPEVDAATWKVSIGGEGANGRAEVTLGDLKKMPAVEIVAVNQCSGNRRGLFTPHVPGVPQLVARRPQLDPLRADAAGDDRPRARIRSDGEAQFDGAHGCSFGRAGS